MLLDTFHTEPSLRVVNPCSLGVAVHGGVNECLVWIGLEKFLCLAHQEAAIVIKVTA